MPLRCLVDRPGLLAALAVRGLLEAELVVADEVTEAAGTHLIVARDERHEIALLDAGFDAVPAAASDAAIAARAAALVARAGTTRVGDLVLDHRARTAVRGGAALDLLPREYRLLAFLAARAGATVDRATLLSGVWGLGFDPGTNVVAVHVSRVRARLDRGRAPMLLTVRGCGYRLVAAPGPAR